MARYGLPALANYQKDWAIERARSLANGIDTIRARNTLGAAAALRAQERDQTGGLMRLLPLLMGQDSFNNLIKGGAVQWVKDAWGNLTAQPGPNYKEWADNNTFTTADGNTGFLGEDGQLRVVNPTTGELVDNVGSNWQRGGNGVVSYTPTGSGDNTLATADGTLFNAARYNVPSLENWTATPQTTDAASYVPEQQATPAFDATDYMQFGSY
jgi:hypothetical protein